MFKHLFKTRRFEFGDELVANVTSEPTVGALRAMQRAVAAAGDKGLTGLEDKALTIALLVESWEGEDVPTGDDWPALTCDADVQRRIETVNSLPRSIFVALAEEAAKGLSLSKPEQDSSSEPSA